MLSALFTMPYVREHAASFLFTEERCKLAATCRKLHHNQTNWIRQDWREIIMDPLVKYYGEKPSVYIPFTEWSVKGKVNFLHVNYPEGCTHIIQETLNLARSYSQRKPVTLNTVSYTSIYYHNNMKKSKDMIVDVYSSLVWLADASVEELKALTYPGTDRLLFPFLEKKIKDPLCTLEADIFQLYMNYNVFDILRRCDISTTPIHSIMTQKIYIPCGKNGKTRIRHTFAQMICQVHAHQYVKRLTPRQQQILYDTKNDPELQKKIKSIWEKNWETKSYFSPHWDVTLSPNQKWLTGKGADQRELLRRHMRRTGQKGNISKRRKIE